MIIMVIIIIIKKLNWTNLKTTNLAVRTDS